MADTMPRPLDAREQANIERENKSPKIRCDGFGCNERHPLDHAAVGAPGYELGYWAGWIYVDLNRPDLSWRPLRFCGAWCLKHWLDDHMNRPQMSKLDAELRDAAVAERHRERAQVIALHGTTDGGC